jgi:hypothetical protein
MTLHICIDEDLPRSCESNWVPQPGDLFRLGSGSNDGVLEALDVYQNSTGTQIQATRVG